MLFLISFSFLSYAQHVEFFWTPYATSLTDDSTILIDWMNVNLPENSTILTLSAESYTQLTNLGRFKVAPLSKSKSNEPPYSWLSILFFEAKTPEIPLQILYE